MTTSLNVLAEKDESTVYKKTLPKWKDFKKKIIAQSTPPPIPFPGWDCGWKACGATCTAGVSKLLWNSVKQTITARLSLLPAWMQDQTGECWHIKKQQSTTTRSSGIFSVSARCECPVLDGWKRPCLISYSRPSPRQCSGQVGCTEHVWFPAVMKGVWLSRKFDWMLFNCRALVGWRTG